MIVWRWRWSRLRRRARSGSSGSRASADDPLVDLPQPFGVQIGVHRVERPGELGGPLVERVHRLLDLGEHASAPTAAASPSACMIAKRSPCTWRTGRRWAP